MSMCSSAMPSRLEPVDQLEQALGASRNGAASVSCEPMWQSMPTTSMPGSAAAAA